MRKYRFDVGQQFKETCVDGFEITWELECIHPNGVLILNPIKVPELEHVNKWECGYRRFDLIIADGGKIKNKWVILQPLPEELFTI